MQKTIHFLIIILLTSANLLALPACKSLPPIQNIKNATIPRHDVGVKTSLENIGHAIMYAGERRGWTMNHIKPGQIMADIYIRTHYAKIKIDYSDSAYSISYIESKNLKEKEGKIHPNYNRWISKLNSDILKRLNAGFLDDDENSSKTSGDSL